jgi:hypothetical protein
MNNIEETAEIKDLLARIGVAKMNVSDEASMARLNEMLVELNVALQEAAGIDSILE